MSWFQKISDLFKTIVLMDHKITQLVEVVNGSTARIAPCRNGWRNWKP